MSKNYSVQVLTADGFAQVETRSSKPLAIARAEQIGLTDKVAVRVLTPAGTEVFSAKRPPLRVITKRTKPFTKVVTLTAGEVPEGYVSAYERPRNGAAVLRNEGADQESRYAVMDTATNELVGFAATTRAAGQLMKGLRVQA